MYSAETWKITAFDELALRALDVAGTAGRSSEIGRPLLHWKNQAESDLSSLVP